MSRFTRRLMAAAITSRGGTLTTLTIWPSDPTPVNTDVDDGQALEFGLKFQSSVATDVVGVRFYKGWSNVGTHIGHLWTSDGSVLGSVTFTNETAVGWQQMMFASPIPIAANTTYVVSYNSSNGTYSADTNFFTASGVTSDTLRALSGPESGGNGVYGYGTNVFPSTTFNDTNYWVDVLVISVDNTPPAAPVVTSPDDVAGVTPTVTGTAEASSIISFSVNGHIYSTTTTIDGTWSVGVSDALTIGQTYPYSVTATDSSGNVSLGTNGNMTVGSGHLYLLPASGSYSNGSTIVVTIRENSGATGVNAVQADLTYSASQLQFQSISTAGSPFTTTMQSSGGSGLVQLSVGLLANSVTGDQVVGTVTFTVIGTGNSSISFASSSGIARASDSVDIASIKDGASYVLV